MTPLLLDTLPFLDTPLKERITAAFIEQTPLSLEDETMILSTMEQKHIVLKYKKYIAEHIQLLEESLEQAKLKESHIIQKLIATYHHAAPTTA